MNWQAMVEHTVTGLGYELVGCERSAAGLLRAYIDHPAERASAGAVITVEDCERVTRQLQHVLEVEGCDYKRLEVSSPGLDRPLHKAADYERFSGATVELTLREAFQGRKKYRGQLQSQDGGWRIVFSEPVKGGGEVEQALDFQLDEVRSARLVPEIAFQKKPKSQSAGAAEAAKPVKSPRKKPSNAKSRQPVADEADEQADGDS